MSETQLVVNGKSYQIQNLEPHTTLLHWLREIGLTGCKEGCAEGECGACAVLVRKSFTENNSRLIAVNACLTALAALHQQEIITAEGLGSPQALHPVQEAMVRFGGSQCGYCTPGFISSMANEYYRPERQEFDLEALSGNLCRCTGYRPIADAAHALSLPDPTDPFVVLQKSPAPPLRAYQLEHQGSRFFRPESLADVFALLQTYPKAKLVAGNTDWGVEVNLRHSRAGVQISIAHLPELRQIVHGKDYLELGAALTLSELEHKLGYTVPLLGQWFSYFASRLIRNSATLGGNLGTASPIGDSPPVLLALEAEVVLASQQGQRVVPLEQFFLGYRKTQLQAGELIQAVRIPKDLAPITKFYKIAKRRFDDISSVAAAFALRLESGVVQHIRIGLGGVAATPIRALEAEAFLVGKPWIPQTLQAAAKIMMQAGTPLDDHRASAAYRRAMLEQLMLKFFAEVQL
ncbi:MAG: xanthine dehydrogenase small subunit [Deinococcales bacterium]